MDWLDRTNIWQAFYAFKAFVHQLEFLRAQKVLDEESVLQATSNVATEGKISFLKVI